LVQSLNLLADCDFFCGGLRLSMFSYVEVIVGLEWSLTSASLLVCLFFDILCLLGAQTHATQLANNFVMRVQPKTKND